HRPSPLAERLGTPEIPATPLHSGHAMSGLPGLLIRYGLPGCSAPCADLTGFPANGAFYFQAFSGSVAPPAAGDDYNSDWTPLLMGLSPIGMAASLAAPASCVYKIGFRGRDANYLAPPGSREAVTHPALRTRIGAGRCARAYCISIFQNTGTGACSMPTRFLRINDRWYHCPSGMCVTISVARTCTASAIAFCLAGSASRAK